MSRADEVIRGVLAALEAKRALLEDEELRGVILDAKLNGRTGEVRVVLVTPTYEIALAAWRG